MMTGSLNLKDELLDEVLFEYFLDTFHISENSLKCPKRLWVPLITKFLIRISTMKTFSTMKMEESKSIP